MYSDVVERPPSLRFESRKPFWNRAIAMIENINNKKKKTSRRLIGKQRTDICVILYTL